MTLRELSQSYHLEKEIEESQQRLKNLKDAVLRISAPSFEERSHPTGYIQGKIEVLTAEITDLETIILSRQIQCIVEKKRLERYISSIKDSYIRRIFTLRFVDGLTWLQVANKIGGKNSEDGVRKACCRYIADNKNDKL